MSAPAEADDDPDPDSDSSTTGVELASASPSVAPVVPSSAAEPSSTPRESTELSCEVGCVLEYNACMWDYGMSCKPSLDACAASCE